MPPVVPLIIMGLSAIEQIGAAVEAWIAAGQQTGELSPEAAQAFRKKMADAFATSRYKTDAELGQ